MTEEMKRCTACKMNFLLESFKRKRNGEYYKQCSKCCDYKKNKIPECNYEIETLYNNYVTAFDEAYDWLKTIGQENEMGDRTYYSKDKCMYHNILYDEDASLITNYKGLKDKIGIDLIKTDRKLAKPHLIQMTEYVKKDLKRWKAKYAEKGYI